MRPDRVAILDWSAAAKPTPLRPSADAIWLGLADTEGTAATYHRTRAGAEAALHALVADTLRSGTTLLLGADFPFGFPAGFAQALTGRPGALSLWPFLAARIHDGPDNANRRFRDAAELNACFPGLGPFWGRPAAPLLPALPEKGTARTFTWQPARRACEILTPGAQEVWKLYTTGSVGSQALLGIPALHRLREAFPGRIAVWPFEPPAQVTLAEVFPSLLSAEVARRLPPGPRPKHARPVKDEVQVTLLAAALLRLSEQGALAPLLAPDAPPESLREEGWILGVGHEPALRAAAAVLP